MLNLLDRLELIHYFGTSLLVNVILLTCKQSQIVVEIVWTGSIHHILQDLHLCLIRTNAIRITSQFPQLIPVLKKLIDLLFRVHSHGRVLCLYSIRLTGHQAERPIASSMFAHIRSTSQLVCLDILMKHLSELCLLDWYHAIYDVKFLILFRR